MTELSTNKNYLFFKASRKYKFIAGVDEVGRGTLFGPVVAAAVVLPDKYNIKYLTDSKKLSERQREMAFLQIQEQAVSYAIGSSDVNEINKINIFHASLLAMSRAVNNLTTPADLALVDGKFLPKNLTIPMKAVIKGDLLEDIISAASIVAKVTRDRLMTELDLVYPNYGLAKHKGYGTKQHLSALQTYGATPLHRKDFSPIKSLKIKSPDSGI